MWWCNRLAVFRAGGRAVRLRPGDPLVLDRLDGLVIGGGDDITATLYGGELDPAVRIDPERDRLELGLLETAASRNWPTLGICRGAQMINVAFGGTLHADIHAIYREAPRLRTVMPRKTVRIEPGSRLHAILDCERCRVNALHHQSVDRLGRGLRVVARDEYDIVQGVERPEPPFLIGVQWHPEFLILDHGQQRLFRRLVTAARAGRAGSAATASDHRFAE